MRCFWNTAIVFVSAILAGFDCQGQTWWHDNQDKWPGNCNGTAQSPVAITKEAVVHDPSLRPLHFYSFGAHLKNATLLNDGHTLRVTFAPNKQQWPGISSGPLGFKYNFAHMHFHWGVDDQTGSEHTIGKKHYAAELHLVHTKDGLTLEEAYKSPDGIAVLAILFEPVDLDENSVLDIITNGLKYVTKPGQYVDKSGVTMLRWFIPPDTSNYYTYNGSLTTPGCEEVVTWIIFVDSYIISSRQLKELRKLFTGQELANGTRPNLLQNNRKTQPLNKRKIRIRKLLKYDLPSTSEKLFVEKFTFSIVLAFFAFNSLFS